MTASGSLLVVDDDPETHRIVDDAVPDMSLDSRIEATGDRAVETARARKPAVILLEAELSDSSGYDVLAQLRGDPHAANIPVVLLTRAQHEHEVARAFQSGADDFLHKPLRTPELIARVNNVLRFRRSVDELARKQRDAQVMLELTQTLNSSLDFRDILYTVVRRIAEVIDVARTSIVLAPEPEQNEVGYVVVASDDAELSNLKLDLGRYPEIQKVLQSREPLTIPDASTHPLFEGVRDDLQHVQHSAMSLFPIVWEDQAIGVLFLRARESRWLSERETHLCQIVANATAVALRNARVMQSLRNHTEEITSARFEAERRLSSLKRYADLFASSTEGIAVIDAQGRLLFGNPRSYHIVGYDEEALKGLRMRDILHPDDVIKARRIWIGFRRGEFPDGVDMRVVRQDGHVVICNCSFASLGDGEGTVLLTFRDVTEERQTEAELKKTKEFLESLVDASVDGIIAADMKGKIILFNHGAERIYGYNADDIVGHMNARELYPGDGAREIMKMLRSSYHGGVGKLEPTRVDVLNSQGERVPISLSAALIYEDGEPTASFGIFIDLREKLRVEERLAQAQQKLAITEKQALVAELAGTAAHELNQPLTSIMTYAGMLQRKLGPETPEHHATQMMVQEVERMAEIVRKIGRMTQYETKSYVGQQQILDLERSQDPERATDKH